MTAESFEILRRSFQRGLSVDLKTFRMYYKKSKKELEYIRYDDKEYVIINKQLFWVPMVIGAFLGFNVIGTTWVPKDGNNFNYHPGNYLFLTDKEKMIYDVERNKTKLTWEAFDEIKNAEIIYKTPVLAKIAEKYDIPLQLARNIKNCKTFKAFGLGYQLLQSQNKMI